MTRLLPPSLWASIFAVTIRVTAPAQEPVVSFYLLPDDNGGPGSDSMATGQLPGPGGGPVTVGFDFTEGQSQNRPAILTLFRNVTNPSVFNVADLHFEGFDPALGATFTLTRAPGQTGTLFTTGPGGSFGVGAQVTLSAPVLISIQGGGFGPGIPPSGSLLLSGTLVPGNFHQVVQLSGGISTLTQVAVALHMKQDLLLPGIEFHLVADIASSTATRTGGTSEPVQGSVVLHRDATDHRVFTIGPVALELTGAPPFAITAPAGFGGIFYLDPVTRTMTAALTWSFAGVTVTRVVDGLGESFQGPATGPTALRISEPGLPGLQDLVIDLRRVELVPGGATATLGQIYQPLFRCSPGLPYAFAASLDPSPGFNTLVGDLPLEPDLLFYFSIDPANGIFLNPTGIAPASGEVRPQILIPNDPFLTGVTFFLGGVNLSTQPFGILAVTNPHRVII